MRSFLGYSYLPLSYAISLLTLTLTRHIAPHIAMDDRPGSPSLLELEHTGSPPSSPSKRKTGRCASPGAPDYEDDLTQRAVNSASAQKSAKNSPSISPSTPVPSAPQRHNSAPVQQNPPELQLPPASEPGQSRPKQARPPVPYGPPTCAALRVPSANLINSGQSIAVDEAYQDQYRLTRDALLAQPTGKQFELNENVVFGKLEVFCRYP